MKSTQLLAVFFVIALVFLAVQYSGILKRVSSKEIKVGGARFYVEVADTPIARARGLSGRDSLASDSGMLFLFSEPGTQVFWMKDMKFPIDIIWIKGEKVIGMVIGAEPEDEEDYELYKSPEPVDKVLEINAGLVSRLGIKVGDQIAF